MTEPFCAQKRKAAASSYAVRDGSVTPVSPSVGNGRSEICWAVVTKDDRIRVHDELRRRRHLPLRGRPGWRAHPGGRCGGDHGGRPAGAPGRGPHGGWPLPLRDRRRLGQHLRLGGRGRRIAVADRLVGGSTYDGGRRGDVGDAPRTALPRDVDHSGELERGAHRFGGNRGPELPDRRGPDRRSHRGPATVRPTTRGGERTGSLRRTSAASSRPTTARRSCSLGAGWREPVPTGRTSWSAASRTRPMMSGTGAIMTTPTP